MTSLSQSSKYIWACVIILSGALLWMRGLTPAFGPGIEAIDRPTYLLSLCLFIGGTAWFILFLILRQEKGEPKGVLPILLLCGLALRLIFFESQPVHENDYKRYLWDGAVTASLENPYRFSPKEVFDAGQLGARSVPNLTHLAFMSRDADEIAGQINSPVLTTIYPPAAQAVFALAHKIAPFKKWGLQLTFLITEILGLFILLTALKRWRQPLIWSTLYWLNPVIIFTTYNGIHMDVLLVAPILGALLSVNSNPIRAACLLSVAAAVKIWPLLLAPVLFRNYWPQRRALYFGVAALIAALTLISLAPMLLSTGKQSGLSAYSASWTNSSFLFPGLRDLLSLLTNNSDRLARYFIATGLGGLSLWFGFFAKTSHAQTMPFQLIMLSGAFVLLSPTGYPWYFIWFLMFLPFAAQHWSARGLAFLTIGAAVYFTRFKIGETGNYDLYTNVLLPLEFGLALLILAWDGLKVNITSN